MANFVDIGELNQRVEIVSFIDTVSDVGTSKKVEGTVIGRWAKVIDVTGSEDEDGKVIALSVRKYVVNYTKALFLDATNCVVRYIDGDYDIHHAAPLQDNRFLELKCSKRE